MNSAASLRVPLDRYTDPPLSPEFGRAGHAKLGSPVSKLRAEPSAVITDPIEPGNRPPDEWLRRIVLAILEVIHNKRAAGQLRGIVAPAVLRQLDLRRQVTTKHLATTVLGIRVAAVSPRVLELSCSFQAGQRVYPLALRVELHADRWLVTACEIGPH